LDQDRGSPPHPLPKAWYRLGSDENGDHRQRQSSGRWQEPTAEAEKPVDAAIQCGKRCEEVHGTAWRAQ